MQPLLCTLSAAAAALTRIISLVDKPKSSADLMCLAFGDAIVETSCMYLGFFVGEPRLRVAGKELDAS